MHRTIGYLSKRFVSVRAGEGRKVLLTFLYFFLVITAYYVIKPVSRSLVLGGLGSRLVPYVDLISAMLMGPIVSLFARLVDRIEKRRLVSLTFWGAVVSLVVFWRLVAWPATWVPAVFYVWVSIFSVLVVTLFWLVANDLYHPREAKRLFGFIGSGGILGGIVGSSIAAIGAKLFGTEQLLLCSAAILIGCWCVVQRLWRHTRPLDKVEPPVNVPAHRRAAAVEGSGSLMGLLRRSRYLVLLVGLVGIAKIVSTLIYYQFNPFIEQMFPGQDAKTSFTGLFFGWMNVASFVIQFFLTSWVLRRLGLTCALLVLPIGLLGGSLGLLLAPLFWVAASTELFDGSVNYSLQQTGKEVLYLPIDRSVRYKVKPFIDMVVFRVGKGVAAVIGIVCLDVFHLPARTLSYLTLPLIVVWIAIALQLRHDYVKTIRGILQARAASRRHRDLAAVPHDSLQQKLALVSRLVANGGALSDESRQLLEALASDEQRLHGPTRWGSAPSLEQLKDCLADRHESMADRRAAIKHMVQQDGQAAVDCLLGMLMVEEDVLMRRELIRGLTKLRLRGPRLEIPKRLIRRQIAKEVDGYQRVLQVASVYRRFSSVPAIDADPVLGLLRMNVEETTEQIVRLLSLLYRPEDIYLIYHQLRQPDAYVRADAIELLDNLIDPGLRRLIVPVLDEDRFLDGVSGSGDQPAPEGGEAYRVLQEGLGDHDRWLCIVIICLIGRLRLQPLLQELDRVAESPIPVVALAARAARQLATEAGTPPVAGSPTGVPDAVGERPTEAV